MSVPFKEFRCSSCKKLLFRGWISEGVVEVKCKSCHAFTTVTVTQFNEMLCAVLPCPHRIQPQNASAKSAV